MNKSIKAEDISIRSYLKPGDIGYITWLHGDLYSREYNYGISFESYVAEGLCEFYKQFDPAADAVWICEHLEVIVGFMLLMHRDQVAQLRYFILKPEYRGIGLGNLLMKLFVEKMQLNNYRSAFLWTTDELIQAAHLYRKYGFILTEEKVSSAFGKQVKEQRYELMLKK